MLLHPMSSTVIQALADRLRGADPTNAHEQREIFERIRELRSAFDGPLDPESHRCLEAAGMLVAYLARMGALAGEDVRTIAVRLLLGAARAEDAAASGGKAAPPAPAIPSAPPPHAPSHTLRTIPTSAGVESMPSAPAEERTATDLVAEMMLGQILLQRGFIFEEHIHQAMKVQRTTSMRMGDILVKIGACSRAQVADALTYQASLRRLRENLGEGAGAKVDKNSDTRGTGLKLVGEAMLGEILIQRNVVTRKQLERALEVQKQTGARVGEALVKLGVTTMDQIEQALRIQGRDRRFGSNTAAQPGKGDGKRSA